MSDEPNPYAKRQLNKDHRLKLINLALTRFVDAEARELEMVAQDQMVAATTVDLEGLSKAELAFAMKYGMSFLVSSIGLPTSFRCTGKKSFDVGGREVDHRDRLTFDLGPDLDRPVNLGSQKAVNEFVKGTRSFGYRARVPLRIPHRSIGGVHFYGQDDACLEVGNDGVFDGHAGKWQSSGCRESVVNYAKARAERWKAECAVQRSAIRLIQVARTYGVVLDVWPEVSEIGADLFGPSPLPRDRLLAVVSQDDLAAVCNNLSRRGISSQVCLSHLSPAYEEAVTPLPAGYAS